MTDTSVKILAKGCEKTGITEELANKLYTGGTSTVLAIVEFSVAKEHVDRNTGKKSVDLTVDTIEPVIDGKLNGVFIDHVRDINAALFRNRMLEENGDQLPLDGDQAGPSNKDLLQQGDALIERNDLNEPVGIFSNKNKTGATS